MKKKIGFILILSVFILFAFVIFYFKILSPHIAVQEILPDGAVLHFQQKDGSKLIAQFSNTPTWYQWRKINVPVLMKKGDMSEEHVKLAQLVTKYLGPISDSLLLRKFFGRELAITIYPFETKNQESPTIDQMLSQVTIVARLEKGIQFIDFVGRLLGIFKQDFKVEEESYKGFKVTHVHIPALALISSDISYARIQDLLIFGFGDEAARSCIDTYFSKGKSLARDKNFLSAKSQFLENAQTFAYVDLDAFNAKVKGPLLKSLLNDDTKEAQVRAAFQMLEGFHFASLSIAYDATIHVKTNLNFDPQELNTAVSYLSTCQPKQNQTVGFVPARALAYQWSDCVNFGNYWRQLQADVARVKLPDTGFSIEQWKADLEQILKLDIEKDIFPVLGKEQGWVLSSVDFSYTFPLPRLFYFVKVVDQTQAEQVMRALLDQPFILLQPENYKGVDMKYISTPFGEDFQPGYCYLKDYLVLASSRQVLKQILDMLEKPGDSLIGDPTLKQMDLELTQEHNGIFFVRVRELVHEIEKLIVWGNEWFTARTKEIESFRAGSERRIANLRGEVSKSEREVKTLKGQMQNLEEKKNRLIADGGDASLIQAKIDEIQKVLPDKEKSLADIKEKVAGLEQMMKDLEQDELVDPEFVKVVLEQGIKPFLNGLKAVKAIGSKVLFREDSIETEFLINVEP